MRSQLTIYGLCRTILDNFPSFKTKRNDCMYLLFSNIIICQIFINRACYFCLFTISFLFHFLGVITVQCGQKQVCVQCNVEMRGRTARELGRGRGRRGGGFRETCAARYRSGAAGRRAGTSAHAALSAATTSPQRGQTPPATHAHALRCLQTFSARLSQAGQCFSIRSIILAYLYNSVSCPDAFAC